MRFLLRSFVFLPALMLALVVIPSAAFSMALGASVGLSDKALANVSNDLTLVSAFTSPPGTVPTPPGTVPTPPGTVPQPPQPTPPAPTFLKDQATIYPHIIKKVIGDRLSPTIYAFTENGYLYRSDHDGRLWSLVTTAAPVEDFLMSSADPNVLYSGTGVDCRDPRAPNQPFFRSTDGGVTWRELPTAINLRPLLIDPTDPMRLFAADCNMLYLSLDGGRSWQEKPDNAADRLWLTHRVVGMAAAALVEEQETSTPHWRQLYAIGVDRSGNGVVAFSDDEGESWVSLIDPATALESPQMIVAHQTQAGLVWVVTAQGVWTTSDYGVNWSLYNRGLREFTALRALTPNAITYSDEGALYLATVRGLYTKSVADAAWRKVTGTSFDELPLSGLLLTESNPAMLWVNSAEDGVFVYRLANR
ncbi:MAG: hypothetical protein NZ553_04740 [Caldilinea sp.]|nr:hypothetical protein [Caldilinea sp.]MDW8439763.1 hypothetical protein [Caldilineaceae bacterium]